MIKHLKVIFVHCYTLYTFTFTQYSSSICSGRLRRWNIQKMWTWRVIIREWKKYLTRMLRMYKVLQIGIQSEIQTGSYLPPRSENGHTILDMPRLYELSAGCARFKKIFWGMLASYSETWKLYSTLWQKMLATIIFIS